VREYRKAKAEAKAAAGRAEVAALRVGRVKLSERISELMEQGNDARHLRALHLSAVLKTPGKEAAVMLGISRDNFYQRVHRGLSLLGDVSAEEQLVLDQWV
jgi:DNA-directed RNA polymerase specialized sigma24 family protein